MQGNNYATIVDLILYFMRIVPTFLSSSTYFLF